MAKKRPKKTNDHWKPFGVKLSEDDKELIAKAADLDRLPLAAFIRTAAIDRARERLNRGDTNVA